jgi:hypothetical protein
VQVVTGARQRDVCHDAIVLSGDERDARINLCLS